MAPGLNQTPGFVGAHAPRSKPPEYIKTSGQHPPIYEQLRSYEAFPKEIIGPTVWDANDYKSAPERWTHWLTEDEISELSDAADKFGAASLPLTDISKVSPITTYYFLFRLTSC